MEKIIYDVIDKKELSYHTAKLERKTNKSFGQLSSLVSGKRFSIGGRYILIKNKHLLFTLIDFNTKEEFQCISNKSILLHLKIIPSNNKRLTNHITGLRSGRSNFITIDNRLFCLKDNKRLPVMKASIVSCSSTTLLQQKATIKFKYKIRRYLSSRLARAVRVCQANKKYSTLNLIGCEIDFLMDYLSKKFTQGMSWTNYGKWHIDHIKPCASFNMLDPQQQKECFHYTNLQPLWAEDNMKKGVKLIWQQP